MDAERGAKQETKRIASIEKWTWLLIYGGLLSLSLGLFVLRGPVSSAGLGWALVLLGVAGVVAGVVLVVLRSRLPETPKLPPEP